MKCYFTAFSLTLLFWSGYAQVVPVQGISLNPIDQSIFRQWASEADREIDGEVIEGTPYLFDQWTKGELTTIKGQNHTNVELKLNLFTDQLIHRNPFTKDSTLIIHQYVTYYKLYNQDTSFSFYYVPPRSGQGHKVKPEDFYLVLLDDRNALLGRPEVKIRRATQNTLVNADGQMRDRFVHSNEFYLRHENEEITKIKNSRNAFVKSLPHHQSHIKAYIKTNKYDLSNIEHLKAIVSYYNALFK